MPEALTAFINKNLKTIKKISIEAIKEQVDKESYDLVHNITNDCPVRYGNLKRSITFTQKTGNKEVYGWVVTFEGYDPNGRPYSLIARSLNAGTKRGPVRIAPRKFIRKAVRKLKGMDDRIFKLYLKKMEQLPKP
jgi:hypothetical protein